MKSRQRHRNGTAKTRPAPRGERGSVTLQITTTKGVIAAVDLILQTGLFGTSRAACAERLLCEAVRAKLTEGVIQKQRKAFEL